MKKSFSKAFLGTNPYLKTNRAYHMIGCDTMFRGNGFQKFWSFFGKIYSILLLLLAILIFYQGIITIFFLFRFNVIILMLEIMFFFYLIFYCIWFH